MTTTERPWGTYTILYETSTAKVKEIKVKPDQILSYQSHSKRSEDWVIIEGSGFVILDDVRRNIRTGEHIRIDVGVKHRIGNDSLNEDLVFIEVQTGSYFGEDDIVRYEDEYGRK